MRLSNEGTLDDGDFFNLLKNGSANSKELFEKALSVISPSNPNLANRLMYHWSPPVGIPEIMVNPVRCTNPNDKYHSTIKNPPEVLSNDKVYARFADRAAKCWDMAVSIAMPDEVIDVSPRKDGSDTPIMIVFNFIRHQGNGVIRDAYVYLPRVFPNSTEKVMNILANKAQHKDVFGFKHLAPMTKFLFKHKWITRTTFVRYCICLLPSPHS